MFSNGTVIAAAFGYIGLLFVIAFYGDRLTQQQRARAGTLIYPLSLAIYCTSWTFFGSVGLATRTSVEFLAIYIGPAIMFIFCKPVMLRVIDLAKSQNITSIADFIAARYGKSQAVAATAALIAIIGSVPYIALQLKAVAASLETILNSESDTSNLLFAGDVALFVTAALTVFAVLFGTRRSNATEHQHGLMIAVAAESIVKLVAFVAAGIFITFVMTSPQALIQSAMKTPEALRAIDYSPSIGNFAAMTLLSFFAILLLPRQFHVSVVENSNVKEVSRAQWLFPLYLVAINIFVIPIALAGLVTFPFGAVNSDMFVLALPIDAGSKLMSLIVFVGGLSAATAMVIVECVALAVMVSNDIVLPLVLQSEEPPQDGAQNYGRLLLTVRRIAIVGIMLMAYLYYHALGNAQLAAIGLISFAAIAQLAPVFFGGLVWRRGTAAGAIGGMIIGFAMWAYTLFLPSFIDIGPLGTKWIQEGLFGIQALRPQNLLGSEMSPLIHGLLWSLTLNILTYIALSYWRQPSSIERLQADIFVPTEVAPVSPNFRRWRSTVTIRDLFNATSQYLGQDRAREAFDTFARTHDISLDHKATADFQLLRYTEHLIASSVGAASSRLVMSLLLRKRAVSAKAALKLLDDAHAALHFNREILQTALDHVRQGIAVFNQEQQLICSNRQFSQMLDLPAHVVQIGIPLREILEYIGKPGDAGLEPSEIQLHQRLAAYTQDGEPFLERIPHRNMVVEVRPNAMPGGGLVVTFSDITPSFEAAEALERANATLERRVRERTEELTRLNNELAQAKIIADEANISKTRFLAAASHDILQPLNAARLYVTSLVERQHGGENARLVDNIDDSLEAIEEILGALLDISRLDAGAMTPSISSFRMSDLMRSLQVEFMPLAREKNLDLRFVSSTLAVKSDRVLLRRLLQNLISNAIKYTPNGKVLVGCRVRGRSLQICIHDTGVGIPPQKRKEIFKEFHRLDQGARIARGLGLGLSIVERIVRVLEHGIAIDANRSGGSFFSVTLPVALGFNQVQPPAANSMISSKAPMSGTTIVCIENDPAILDGMKTLLKGWGADVIAAVDPKDACKLIAASNRPITGLLVDYHLDRGNGIAAIRDIRHKFGATIPAILITADRSPPVRDSARAYGIVVLNKPVKPATLRALLSQWRAQHLVLTQASEGEAADGHRTVVQADGSL